MQELNDILQYNGIIIYFFGSLSTPTFTNNNLATDINDNNYYCVQDITHRHNSKSNTVNKIK